MGRLHRLALDRSEAAEACGALVPLSTVGLEAEPWTPFQVRRLLSRTPKHLRGGGPRPNPFLPWEPALELERLGDGHVVLLNKFPVQRGHLLLISQQWQPQAGWLSDADWQAVAAMEADTPGLWFFNSCAAAGASQPHRHLQLLPREPGDASCPLAASIEQQLGDHSRIWPWSYRISRRQASGSPAAAAELADLYHGHLRELGLGEPQQDPAPRHPYNLLFDSQWLMTVHRTREHWAGLSVNALGFAGYLLLTEQSDEPWLRRSGPLALLEAVAAHVP
jgi:ATP adenylyltransferase